MATLAVALTSCGPSVLSYKKGTPSGARAKFESRACQLESHLRIPATETQFYLIDGRRSYALLVLDEHAVGQELENYFKDEQGHHFAIRIRHRAWQYSFPDERGAAGTLAYYENSFSPVPHDDGYSISGTPLGSCTLESVALPDTGQPDETSCAERVCVPGATQACTGKGACNGGQACLKDGSGWGSCECEDATPEAPAPEAEAEGIEEDLSD
jgi:hypothetical protein